MISNSKFWALFWLDLKFDIPSAISRSDSAKANLAVNRSKVFNVLSLALGEAPSIAALMAWISSANEEDCEDLFLWWSPGDSIPTKKKLLMSLGQDHGWSSWTQIRIHEEKLTLT